MAAKMPQLTECIIGNSHASFVHKTDKLKDTVVIRSKYIAAYTLSRRRLLSEKSKYEYTIVIHTLLNNAEITIYTRSTKKIKNITHQLDTLFNNLDKDGRTK